MKTEPVAWAIKSDNDFTEVGFGDALLEEVEQMYAIEGWKYEVIPLYTHPAEPKELTVPENSQDWKGMDGATAFWLIERHSNHWDDAKLMMEEWLKANIHPAKHLSLQKIDGELVAVTYTDDEHRIIEVLWEKPPAKTLTPLTEDECEAIINRHDWFSKSWREMAKEIHDAILKKAQG